MWGEVREAEAVMGTVSEEAVATKLLEMAAVVVKEPSAGGSCRGISSQHESSLGDLHGLVKSITSRNRCFDCAGVLGVDSELVRLVVL